LQNEIKRGDKIAIISFNHLDTVVQYFAIWTLGAVAVPINIGEDDKRIEYILTNSQTKLAFIREHYLSRIETIIEQGSSLKEKIKLVRVGNSQTVKMKNNYDAEAAGSFDKAVKMDSTKCSLWSELANKYYTAKDYHDAATYFQKSVDCSKQPDIKDVMTLGRAYYFDSAYAKADTAFMHATVVAPEWPIGYRWRAVCNLNMDSAANPAGLAIPFYTTMIEKAVKDSVKYTKELKEGYKYLGDIYTFKEDYAKSVYYYTKYLELDPENETVKTNMSSCNFVKNE